MQSGLACTEDATRNWLWTRQKERWADRDLRDCDIDWIMHIEGNETCILSWQKNKDDRDLTPASGGQWMLKRGKTVTLAQFCWWCKEHLTCHAIYREWLRLPICCHKRYHSMSHTDNAQKRRNARILHHSESGGYGLNGKPDKQPAPRDN